MIEEQAQNLRAVGLGRIKKRSRAIDCARVDVRAVAEKQGCQLDLAGLGRPTERGGALAVPRVDRRAPIEKGARFGLAAQARCGEELRRRLERVVFLQRCDRMRNIGTRVGGAGRRRRQQQRQDRQRRRPGVKSSCLANATAPASRRRSCRPQEAHLNAVPVEEPRLDEGREPHAKAVVETAELPDQRGDCNMRRAGSQGEILNR